MLNDYKGETPKNVITEDEHKKRPFYKKVSFWVLSALGLFFGGCSVFGLVLGYQYVDAVTQAAHIIADRNDSDDVADSGDESKPIKQRPNLYTPSYTGTQYQYSKVTLDGNLPYYWSSSSNTVLTYDLVTNQYTSGTSGTYELSVGFDWNNSGGYFIVQFYNYNTRLNIDDYGIVLKVKDTTITARYNPIAQYQQMAYQAHVQYFNTGTATPFEVSLYLHPYDAGYNQGQNDDEDARQSGYDDGYDAGYEQGYDDGKLVGISQGESQAASGQKALVTMFVTAFQQPFDQIYRFLNFNVLGLNILALFTSLLTLSIGIVIIKKVI